MWHMIAGPLIGAVIGYFTNYIAVKMLFRPRKEIRLWGHRLPLTPGAIPRGKPRLARAVGAAVAGSLVTGEDIENRLLQEDTENQLVSRIMSVLAMDIRHLTGMLVGETPEDASGQEAGSLEMLPASEAEESTETEGQSESISTEVLTAETAAEEAEDAPEFRAEEVDSDNAPDRSLFHLFGGSDSTAGEEMGTIPVNADGTYDGIVYEEAEEPEEKDPFAYDPEAVHAEGLGAADRIELQLSENLSRQILQAAEDMDIAGILMQKGGDIVRSKVSGTMLAMFVNDRTIDSFLQPVGTEVNRFLAEEGMDRIYPQVRRRVHELEDRSVLELLEDAEVTRCMVREGICSLYRELIHTGCHRVMEQMDLAGMVEERINAMSVEELEKLVFQVMRSELNTIVNLGALIGFILGCLNLLF